MYAKISSNTIIKYPAFPTMDHPSVGFPENWQGGTVNDDEYVYVQRTEKPVANVGWEYTEGRPNLSDNGWIQVWNPSLLDKNLIKRAVASKRYEVEVSGITVSNNVYSTDRESQTKYVAVAVDISRSNAESWSITWKTLENKFVTLNSNQALEIVNSVRDHVQSCFNKEAEYYNLIDTSNNAVLETIDFSAGWPSNN